MGTGRETERATPTGLQMFATNIVQIAFSIIIVKIIA
jgi:hypothetical protein